MLVMDAIQSAQTECASLIVLAPKKDGTLWICVDYWKLNAVRIWDSYTLLHMNEWINLLGSAEIFSALDVNSGYLQVEISQVDRDKTAISPHNGLFRQQECLLDWEESQKCFNMRGTFKFLSQRAVRPCIS